MLGNSVDLPVPLGAQLAAFAVLGALSAAGANRGVTVWHDGLRPVMPSLVSRELPQRDVSRTSFNLALGFLWAFGLPFSLGYVIPLVYMVFIATDWIGVSLPADYDSPWYKTRESLRGVAASLVCGAAWGAAVSVGLWAAAKAMHHAHIEMAVEVQLITEPALGAFFLFAVLTVAYHYGIRHGVIAAVVTTLAWGISSSLDASSPAAWSFAAGMVLLIGYVAREASRSGGTDNIPAEWALEDVDDDVAGAAASEEIDLFKANVARIKRNLPLILVIEAVSGAAYNGGLMASDPISGALYAHGLVVPAVFVVLAWAVAFIPMKYTTAIVTGCMCTGSFLEACLAMLMPNPWVAAIAVCVLRVAEVYSLIWVVENFEKFPNIREVADILRTAIFHVMEIAFLVGGTVAAMAFAGEWGAAAVVGAWFFNSRSNSPVMPMSLGAVAAIGVGVVANAMHLVGLGL